MGGGDVLVRGRKGERLRKEEGGGQLLHGAVWRGV